MLAESELQSELQGLTDCTPDGQGLTEPSSEFEPGHSVDEPIMITSSLTHAATVTSDSPSSAHSSPPGAELPMLTQPAELNACTEPIITPTNLLDAPSQQSISAIKQDSSDSISPSDRTHSRRCKSANDVSTWLPSSLPDAHTAGIKRQLAHLTAWGGENIYLAREAGLVTAKKAGHRTPAEKALGLQKYGDSILAKWGQPHAPVSEPPSGSQSSIVAPPPAGYPTQPHSCEPLTCSFGTPGEPEQHQEAGQEGGEAFQRGSAALPKRSTAFQRGDKSLRSTAQPFKEMAKPLKKAVKAIKECVVQLLDRWLLQVLKDSCSADNQVNASTYCRGHWLRCGKGL
ncbi:TPA: hypothetical protein ACH3X1_015447 [Trebouxia sp. C0004]